MKETTFANSKQKHTCIKELLLKYLSHFVYILTNNLFNELMIQKSHEKGNADS